MIKIHGLIIRLLFILLFNSNQASIDALLLPCNFASFFACFTAWWMVDGYNCDLLQRSTDINFFRVNFFSRVCYFLNSWNGIKIVTFIRLMLLISPGRWGIILDHFEGFLALRNYSFIFGDSVTKHDMTMSTITLARHRGPMLHIDPAAVLINRWHSLRIWEIL